MESIFISRVTVALVLTFVSNLLVGQNSYYVFQKEGNPFFNGNKTAERGSPFASSDTLHIAEKDYILLVDKAGELYEMTEPNTYLVADVGNYKRQLEKDSFTKKYFTYVWKQFTNQYKKKQEAGVVYREERIIQMVEPIDSVKLYAPEIRFSWNNKTDTDEVFFMLKDLETNHLTKIGTTGNTLLLHLDNQLLKPGKQYEWALAETSFPNLKELKFRQLNVLTKEANEKLKTELGTLIAAFRLLGFSDFQIKQAICMDYKFCM